MHSGSCRWKSWVRWVPTGGSCGAGEVRGYTPRPMSATENADQVDVAYVAQLARLHLSDAERTQFQRQLENILSHVNELKEVDVSGVEPTAHAIPVKNVFRADEPRASLDHDAVIANAPREKAGQFFVPKIIE